MKRTAIVFALATLALVAWAAVNTAEYRAAVADYRAQAKEPLAQLQAREQQDAARYKVCDAQRVDNPAARTIDFTADGRRCLIGALETATSVQGTLVLVRNAAAALAKNPTDQDLRNAALTAVAQAREQLVQERPWLHDRLGRLEQVRSSSWVMRATSEPLLHGDRFAEQAAALDQAEFSIHQPRVHHEQQVWRLEAFWAAGKAAGKV